MRPIQELDCTLIVTPTSDLDSILLVITIVYIAQLTHLIKGILLSFV